MAKFQTPRKTTTSFKTTTTTRQTPHYCMLGRVTLRVLPPRTFITRTRSSSKAFGNMSVGADSEQPPAKMARVEDFLRVKKISENAVLPVRGSQGAAGYDLASAYECGALLFSACSS